MKKRILSFLLVIMSSFMSGCLMNPQVTESAEDAAYFITYGLNSDAWAWEMGGNGNYYFGTHEVYQYCVDNNQIIPVTKDGWNYGCDAVWGNYIFAIGDSIWRYDMKSDMVEEFENINCRQITVYNDLLVYRDNNSQPQAYICPADVG